MARKATKAGTTTTTSATAKRKGARRKMASPAPKTTKAKVTKGAKTKTKAPAPAQARPKKDPVVALERAKTRALWKRQADTMTSMELAKHGAMVDERARVRAVTGMSWSNRKPR